MIFPSLNILGSSAYESGRAAGQIFAYVIIGVIGLWLLKKLFS